MLPRLLALAACAKALGGIVNFVRFVGHACSILRDRTRWRIPFHGQIVAGSDAMFRWCKRQLTAIKNLKNFIDPRPMIEALITASAAALGVGFVVAISTLPVSRTKREYFRGIGITAGVVFLLAFVAVPLLERFAR